MAEHLLRRAVVDAVALSGHALHDAGLIIFFVCQSKYGKSEISIPTKAPAEPSAEERTAMDREFAIWATIAVAAALVALLLYALPLAIA
jgi:hypothetical protein